MGSGTGVPGEEGTPRPHSAPDPSSPSPGPGPPAATRLGNVTQESAGWPRPSALSPRPQGRPAPSYLRAGGGPRPGPWSSRCGDAAAAAARRRRGVRLGPDLAPRTGDESARFHSKESPRPPPRSTSGFTALPRLPFPVGQWETTREPAASPEDRPGRTSWAAELSGPRWEGGAEGAGSTPAAPAASFSPRLRAPRSGCRVTSPEGAGGETELRGRRDRNPLRSAFTAAASLGHLRRKRGGGGCEEKRSRSEAHSRSALYPPVFTALQGVDFKENQRFTKCESHFF